MPDGSAGNRYSPRVSVTAVLTPTTRGLRASTVTPGSTAPDASFTTPWIDPPCSCAVAGADDAIRSEHMSAARPRCDIDAPPSDSSGNQQDVQPRQSTADRIE